MRELNCICAGAPAEDVTDVEPEVVEEAADRMGDATIGDSKKSLKDVVSKERSDTLAMTKYVADIHAWHQG